MRRCVGDGAPWIILFGFGLGYYVEAYVGLRRSERLVVIVANIARFLQAISNRDLRSVLRLPDITWLCEEPQSQLLRWAHSIGIDRFSICSPQALMDADRAYLAMARDTIVDFSRRRQINMDTLRRFGRRWVKNIAKNIPLIIQSGSVNILRDKFKGAPALVIGAGPGFDRILPLLAMIRFHALLIAVDTVFARLVKEEISPDLLIVSDPQYWNSRLLDRTKLGNTILIADPAAHPRSLLSLQGRRFFCDSLFPLGRLVETAVGEQGWLGSGGSVATSAWGLAKLCGTDHIWLAGIDLGFPDRRTHFRGSWIEERLLSLSKRLETAETQLFRYLYEAGATYARSNDGGLILSDRRMALYRNWFAHHISRYNRPTYSLDEKGAVIDGAIAKSPRDLLALPRKRNLIDDRVAELASKTSNSSTTKREKLRIIIHKLKDDLKKMLLVASQGCEILDRSELKSADKKTRDRFASIDRKLALCPHRDIVDFLIPSAYLGGQNSIADSSDDLSNKKRYYREVIDSIHYHLEILDEQ